MAPGEPAFVPIRFDKLPPEKDFLVEPLPERVSVVEAIPGRCEGGTKELSLCVVNSSSVDVTLDRGDIVAAVVSVVIVVVQPPD